MSNAYMIEFNYKQAIEQADSLERLSKDLLSLSQEELSSCLSEIQNNWIGDNSDSYIEKGEKLAKNIVTTANKAAKAASTIRSIAKSIYDAEMAALAMAEARTYNG